MPAQGDRDALLERRGSYGTEPEALAPSGQERSGQRSHELGRSSNCRGGAYSAWSERVGPPGLGARGHLDPRDVATAIEVLTAVREKAENQ